MGLVRRSGQASRESHHRRSSRTICGVPPATAGIGVIHYALQNALRRPLGITPWLYLRMLQEAVRQTRRMAVYVGCRPAYFDVESGWKLILSRQR